MGNLIHVTEDKAYRTLPEAFTVKTEQFRYYGATPKLIFAVDIPSARKLTSDPVDVHHLTRMIPSAQVRIIPVAN